MLLFAFAWTNTLNRGEIYAERVEKGIKYRKQYAYSVWELCWGKWIDFLIFTNDNE